MNTNRTPDGHLLYCLNLSEQNSVVINSEAPGLINPEEWKKFFFQTEYIVLGIDNKNALRYDCGDYPDGQCHTKDEICTLLDEANISYHCYSIYPCLKYPQFVYADGVLPNEELMVRYFPKYNHPESVFEIEEFLIDGLIPKGQFHEKANAYLFVCSLNDMLPNIEHITLSADRYPDKAFATIIRTDKTVTKVALFPDGITHLRELDANTQELQAHGVPVVSGSLEDNQYIMPYVDAPLATTYLKETLQKDRNLYISLYDRIVELILQSSEHVGEDEDGIILRHGYIDMVPLNAFYSNDDFLFFDQEFYIENCPAKAVIYRAILIPYCGDWEVHRLCPLSIMLERYGLAEKQEYWQHYADTFLEKLRDPENWAELRKKHGRNDLITIGNKRNRQMRDEQTCFSHVEGRDIYVFGTGRFADKFVDMYHNDYRIVAAVDNDPNKQGTEWKGIPVLTPEELRGNKDIFAMVCIKEYEPICRQLEELDVDHFGVYDAHHVYPGRQADNIPYTGKPYHIGYCAGVYDLFHIGHVNIFRRAKEQCDYLIVGVVTDIGVRNNKHTEPFVPYEERLEMVRSCRYVDEAVEIPYVYCRTPDMFEKYHFDVQFSGSDYEHDPGWLAMKQYLNDRGAEMLFFPYTECTSSTKIKQLIEKGLAE